MNDKIITHNVNFSVFIDKILDGSKRQTIRRERKNPIKVGDKLQLFTGLRTKKCKKLGTAIVAEINYINIWQDEYWGVQVGVNDDNLLYDEVEVLRKADGFDNQKDFFSFFENHYGLPFEGVIIKWKEFKNER